MRYTIFRTIVAAAAILVLLAASAAAVPTVRHIASGWWNSPHKLRALPESPEVHYEDGAVEAARTVAGLLPAAIARVEAVHGRPFAHPVTVGVYVSRDAYAAANGAGDPGSVGLMFLGHVILSPSLFSRQRARLPAILTHEMSHAHLQSWISQLAYIRLPHWFTEGLAVMVADGGGAEGVSEAQAREAIRHGDHIAIERAGSLLNLVYVKFERPPEIPDTPFRRQMSYRQAGLFVTFLRDTSPAGFGRMMNAIMASRPFVDAVSAGYDTDIQTLWLRF